VISSSPLIFFGCSGLSFEGAHGRCGGLLPHWSIGISQGAMQDKICLGVLFGVGIVRVIVLTSFYGSRVAGIAGWVFFLERSLEFRAGSGRTGDCWLTRRLS
jgi:hypothetical protein